MTLSADRPEYLRLHTAYGEIDIMRAWYLRQDFARHIHEGYGIGAITDGAMEFHYRGESLTASRGFVNSVNPDELHDGHSAAEYGWCYSMLYFGEDVFRSVCCEVTGAELTPYMISGVIADGELAGKIAMLAGAVLAGSDYMYAEQQIIDILSTSFIRHSDKKPAKVKHLKLGGRLARVKEYINDNLNTRLTIGAMAETAGVSRYHFIRSFHADTGLAPYEYTAMKRAGRAKNMLLKGLKPVEVSAECGYTDQSHMNRWLKRIYGITPSNILNA